MSWEIALIVLTWVVMLPLSFGMAGIVRQVVIIRKHLESTHAPQFSRSLVGKDLNVVASGFLPRHPEFSHALFLDSDCFTCRQIVEAMTSRIVDPGANRILFVFDGAPLSGVEDLPWCAKVVGNAGILRRGMGIPVTPFGLSLDSRGFVTSESLLGSPAATAEWLNTHNPRHSVSEVS